MATGVFFLPYSSILQSGFRLDSAISLKEPAFSDVSFSGNLFSGQLLTFRSRDCDVLVRPRSFFDKRDFHCYVSPRPDGKKKEKSSEAVATEEEKKKKKKKQKLIKGLSRKLLKFSEIDFGAETGEGLIGEVRGKIISEAASVLLAQLEKQREEENEKNRKQKGKKATLNTAAWISYSSESSDSECEEILTENCLGSRPLTKPQINESHTTQLEAPLTDVNLSIQELQKNTQEVMDNCSSSMTCAQGCGNSCNGHYSLLGKPANKIEVCMGGKCKKSGAVELLAELEKMVGTKGAVVGCKCMGKCKKGPNARVLNKKGEVLLVLK